MNKNKIFTFLLLSAVGIPTFAQGVIYKCTDGAGEITYSTDASSSNCEKTNLAKVDKGNIINKPVTFNGGTPSTVNVTVQNSDQVVRDQKRAIILQGELTQEKTQLKTVLEMISKADKNDVSQISQLKKMEETHKRNIASLEKELGIKGDTQPVNNPANLPFSLPKEAKDVQLVEVPQPPKNQNSPTSTIASSKAPNILPVPNPRVLINPSATTKAMPSSSVAATVTEPPTQTVKPEVVREIKEPAAITNRSIKNRILPQ